MAHTKRDEKEQEQHDNVIAGIARGLEIKEYKVRTNPGTSNRHSVSRDGITYYPDIYTYENKTVTRVYEVETSQTVNEGSVEQWKKYATGSSDFYLVVPKDKVSDARELVKVHNIDVKEIMPF